MLKLFPVGVNGQRGLIAGATTQTPTPKQFKHLETNKVKTCNMVLSSSTYRQPFQWEQPSGTHCIRYNSFPRMRLPGFNVECLRGRPTLYRPDSYLPCKGTDPQHESTSNLMFTHVQYI